MSRTVRHAVELGRDWWSRRPNSGLTAHSRHSKNMKWWKRNTHKIERQQSRAATMEETP